MTELDETFSAWHIEYKPKERPIASYPPWERVPKDPVNAAPKQPDTPKPAALVPSRKDPVQSHGSLSPEEEATVRRLWPDPSYSHEEIAKAVGPGLTADFVRKYGRLRMGLPRRRSGRKPGR